MALSNPENIAKPPLHRIVDDVVSDLVANDPALYSVVVNDVKGHHPVHTDQHLLAMILGCLIFQASLFSGSTGINISAKTFGSITLVHVRNNQHVNEKLLLHHLQRLMPYAEKLGGCLSISGNASKGTTLVLSFFNSVPTG